MAADLLVVAAQRGLAQLDETLSLEVFAAPRTAAPATSRRLAAEPPR